MIIERLRMKNLFFGLVALITLVSMSSLHAGLYWIANEMQHPVTVAFKDKLGEAFTPDREVEARESSRVAQGPQEIVIATPNALWRILHRQPSLFGEPPGYVLYHLGQTAQLWQPVNETLNIRVQNNGNVVVTDTSGRVVGTRMDVPFTPAPAPTPGGVFLIDNQMQNPVRAAYGNLGQTIDPGKTVEWPVRHPKRISMIIGENNWSVFVSKPSRKEKKAGVESAYYELQKNGKILQEWPRIGSKFMVRIDPAGEIIVYDEDGRIAGDRLA